MGLSPYTASTSAYGNVFQGKEIGTLSRGLNALTTPLQNIAVSGGIFLTGVGTLAVAGASTVAVCGGTGGLGCGAFIVFGTVPTTLGGSAIIVTGYGYTKRVTIPSIISLGNTILGH